MEPGEWKRLIEAYSAAGVSQFSFTGGEALLKEGCLELMDFASKRAKVGLLSNGQQIMILGRHGDWYAVQTPMGVGFVFADYVQSY